MSQVLFELHGKNMLSPTFEAPAQLSVYGLLPMQVTYEDGIPVEKVCGDYITFERVIFDDEYEINCKGIKEDGDLASAPLLEDGCPVRMDYGNNSMMIEGKGTYRAVYHGEHRENVVLVKE